MFLKSVIGGFATLLHWQVLVAILVYIMAKFSWLFFVSTIAGRKDSGIRQGAGCFTHMIGGTVFQAILTGLLVLVLIPIMLGGHGFLPLAFFKIFAWPIFKACMIALAATLVLSFLPLVGRLISDTPGADDFIQGIIIFRFFSRTFIERQLANANLPTRIYPGSWESVGYFVIALILIYACLFGFSIIGIKLKRNKYPDDDSVGFFIGIAILPVVSFLPLFMYAKHVSLMVVDMIK